jgi:hypothetical protein
MIVRIINAILGTALLIFCLFGAIRPGALERNANETFARVAAELDAQDSSLDGPYADGCLLELPTDETE